MYKYLNGSAPVLIEYVMFGKRWAICNDGWFEFESWPTRYPHLSDPSKHDHGFFKGFRAMFAD
jgi:hypothetical protein